MKFTLIADYLFDGTQLYKELPVTVVDGHVHSLDTRKDAPVRRVSGILAPGFIDTQVNGGGGVLLNTAPSVQTLQTMIRAHATFGTTNLLATVISSAIETASQVADAVSTALYAGLPGLLGVHFEGPHISSEKKGIHNADVLRPLSDAEMRLYCRDDLGQVVVTIAPEVVPVEQIRTLTEYGVHVSLGHSHASYAQTVSALQAGATGFTHLFNAMSSFTSREPNVTGAALDCRDSWCGIILDGFHVHPAAARIALKAKGADKIMLVTDAMSTVGSDQQEFVFDNHHINLNNDRLLSHTGQLAGSALTMIGAVNNAISMLGVSTCEALRMASFNPAKFLGTEQSMGIAKPGACADFVLLSGALQSSLSINNVWQQGQSIFSNH